MSAYQDAADAQRKRFMTELTRAMVKAFRGLTNGKESPAPETIALWYDVLCIWPIEVVTAAISAHLRVPNTGRTLPIPSDIVEQIELATQRDGRPGPEEAWSIVLTAQDESRTVVWTEEMAACRAIAQPLLANGDEVGGRMAFKEAYNAAIQAARRAGRPPVWSACLGSDPESARLALAHAAERGRIPCGDNGGVIALPAPRQVPVLLLAGPVREHDGTPHLPSAAEIEARARLDELKSRLLYGAEPESHDLINKRRTQALKERMERRVKFYETDGVAAPSVKEHA
jgi:hypothetical protein